MRRRQLISRWVNRLFCFQVVFGTTEADPDLDPSLETVRLGGKIFATGGEIPGGPFMEPAQVVQYSDHVA
ncbi:hypothetical protein [Flavihumibacter petaseus]|uniref:hypothetical protein n=1 Tax=Flavihumibacter petaseus TaxID=549295 RepID=UPI00061D3B10|nr:hypothetical protein [Flavihumibacter petaseus]